MGLSALAGTILASCGREQNGEQQANMEPEPSAEDGLVELLFVQEADGVRFDGDRLTLVGMKPRTLYFSDRPQDIAGFLSYQEFIKLVGEGPDNFQEDPPNATLMIFDGNELDAVVLELSAKPRMQGDDMVFSSVKIIEGDPPAEGGTSALFIDTIGRPLTPVSVAGVHRRHRRRRRRRVQSGPGPR